MFPPNANRSGILINKQQMPSAVVGPDKIFSSSENMTLLLVFASFLYHTDYRVIGVIFSFFSMTIVAAVSRLHFSTIDAVLAIAFVFFFLVQFFLPQDNYFYYLLSTAFLLFSYSGYRTSERKASFYFWIGCLQQLFVLFLMIFLGENGAGAFKNPNAAAAVAIAAFIYTVCRSDISLLKVVVAVACYLPVVFVTESRGALLFIILVGLFAGIVRLNKTAALASYTLFAIGVVLWTSGNQTLMVFAEYISGGQEYNFFGRNLLASRERDVIWTYVVESNTDFWIGEGIGNAHKLMEVFFNFPLSPHNTFLRVYVDGGIFFLTLTVFFLLVTFHRIRGVLPVALFLAVLGRNLFESAIPLGLSSQSVVIFLPLLMSGTNSFGNNKTRQFISDKQ